MTMQKGRDLAVKIGDGADVEIFETLGVARATSLTVNNNAIDITTLNSNGFKELQADGGVQFLSIQLDGIFKDSNAEELLREAALNRVAKNYQFIFPNGDYIASAFVVDSYQRQGSYSGLELFSLKLSSTAAYSFTKGV